MRQRESYVNVPGHYRQSFLLHQGYLYPPHHSAQPQAT